MRLPSAGEYWRAVEEDHPIPKDGVVLVLDVESDSVEFSHEGEGWSEDLDSFLENYRYDPEGGREVQDRVQALMAEARRLEQDHTLLLGEVEQVGEEQSSRDLVTAGEATAEDAKRRIAGVRNKVGRVRNRMLTVQSLIKQRAKEMEAVARVQQRKLEKMTEALEAKLELANEAIWTVNLYLGRKETVKRLRKGSSAPPEEKVVIKQRVRYMDEECALAAEDGGITAVEIEQFDEWLLQPGNLERIMPEPRGVCAFRPRRSVKKSANPWEVKRSAEEDLKTYFLFKNGGNLFRVCPDLNLHGVVFPTQEEWGLFFKQRVYNHETHQFEAEPLRPGSSEYAKAMKAANAKNRHYMRVVLFLQGIFDRTEIFRPVPWGRVNLLDQAACGDFIEFVRDAEKVLGDGRPRFDEWMSGLNSQLEPGMRVMGVFDSYAYRFSFNDTREEQGRVTPNCFDRPNDLELYTLEKNDAGELIFRFKRTEKIFVRDDYSGRESLRVPKTRASFRVRKSDRFILNFDLAREEDIDYYLNSFADRVHYIQLLPLLRRALELKRREKAEEAPFKSLLMSQLKKVNAELALDATSRRQVDELVSWWKFKNRVHRALKEDDAKALRMIRAEYQRRLRQESVDSEMQEKVFAELDRRHPEALVVAHVRERQFVALEAMEDRNIWVRRIDYTWLVRRGELRADRSRDWVVIGRAARNWKIHRASPRWADWDLDANVRDHLTGPERYELVVRALSRLEERVLAREEDHRRWWSSRRHRFLPFAVTWNPRDEEVEVFHSSRIPERDEEFDLGNPLSRPELEVTSVNWEKKRGELFKVWLGGFWSSYAVPKGILGGERRLLWESSENKDRFRQEYRTWLAEERRADARRALVRDIVEVLLEKTREEWLRRERAEFDSDYGDPDLWEEHQKMLEEPSLRSPKTFACVSELVARGVEVVGCTVAEIQAKGEPHLSEKDREEEDSPFLPLQFRVQVEPSETEHRRNLERDVFLEESSEEDSENL